MLAHCDLSSGFRSASYVTSLPNSDLFSEGIFDLYLIPLKNERIAAPDFYSFPL